MRSSTSLAVVAVFSATVIASDYALAGLVDVKLLDAMVFLAGFAFGFRTGAAVAVVSEGVWAFASPWGAAGAITPFLVGGELMFAAAGWGAARLWGRKVTLASPYPVFIGATLLVCAFLWDLETNAATALLAYWPQLTLGKVLATEGVALPFFIAHMTADLLLGLAFVPLALSLIVKRTRAAT